MQQMPGSGITRAMLIMMTVPGICAGGLVMARWA